VNSKQLKGLAVISIADGEKLGTVDGVYVDPTAKRVVGFAVKHGGGLFAAGDHELIDIDDVHALGRDALTLTDKGAVRGDQTRARLDQLVEVDDLLKLKAVTEGGTYVGQIAGVEVDETSFRMDDVEVSPGFFKTNKLVPVHQVVSIGHDLVMVVDAVCSPEGAGPSDPVEHRFVVGDVPRSD
jgi:uncharacterized protein YrrD